MTEPVYTSYELMEAAFRGVAPSVIRSENPSTAFSSSSTPINYGGSVVSSPTSTPTHVDNSYYLHSLGLTIKGGSSITIIDSLITLEIFEDIFSKSIHGYVEIGDISGMLSALVLTGGEYINLTVLKPIPSSEIIIDRDDFVVYQISKVEIDGQNSMTYRLHFMPEAAIQAQKKRIYRSFRTTRSILDVVNSIYSDVSGRLKLYSKADDLPIMQKNFLCPGYTPYEAIDMLTKRASYNGDYFLFFERLNTFLNGNHVFSSINNLRNYWNNESTVPLILYQPKLGYITPQDANALLATTIEIQDNFDHVNNMNMGFYNSRLRMLDIVNRKYYDLNLNYAQIQNEANASKFLQNENIFLNYNHNYPEYPGERLVARPYNDVFANKTTWVRSDVYGSIMLSNMRVNVVIPGGNNLVGAGTIVDFKMPSFFAKSLNLESSLNPDDTVYAGKYMVTAVRHTITIRSYTKRLELSRDSGRINLGYLMNQLSNVPPPGLEYIDRSRVAPVSPPPPPPPPPVPEPARVWPEPDYYSWTCFPEGSMVLMADGTEKAIETIIESDILMGADGQPVSIKILDFPILGSRKMLSFAEDKTMRWSDEHLFWGRNETKQWWWTANHASWIREVEMGAVVGLKDNNSFLPTEGFQFANMAGFVNRTVIDVSHEHPEGPNTKLYLPVNTTGVPFIVNGYVVTGGTNEFTYDYTQFDWLKSRNEVISKIKRG